MPDDQFSAWEEEVGRRFGATTSLTSPDHKFPASLETELVGTLAVSTVTTNCPQVVSRTERDISRHEMDVFTLGLLVEGAAVMAQRGREARLVPGDLVLMDARVPYRLRFDTPIRQVVLTLDRRGLEARLPHAGRRTAVRVDAAHGAARLAATFVQTMREQIPHLGKAEEAISECALDLVALAFGGELMRQGPAGDGDEQVLLGRIKAFIEAHLGDPQLTPDSIASRHGVSRRYLYSLFESAGCTVAGHIWERRLLHCRDALADPREGDRTIAEIAFQFGFNDASHFSRAFRSTFGKSPREFRLAHAHKT